MYYIALVTSDNIEIPFRCRFFKRTAIRLAHDISRRIAGKVRVRNRRFAIVAEIVNHNTPPGW